MDDRLRTLARAARASGDALDRARLLAERARSGALPFARLTLASHAGDGAAREALALLDEVPLELPDDDVDVRAWGLGLGGWGASALARALVAVAADELAGWEAAALAPPDVVEAWLREVGPGRAWGLCAVDAWIACPCRTHARLALEESEAAVPSAAGAAVNLVAAGLDPRRPDAGSPAVQAAADALAAAARELGEERVRAAVAREVGGWATGEVEPLEARARLWERLPERWTRRWDVERPGELQRLRAEAAALAVSAAERAAAERAGAERAAVEAPPAAGPLEA